MYGFSNRITPAKSGGPCFHVFFYGCVSQFFNGISLAKSGMQCFHLFYGFVSRYSNRIIPAKSGQDKNDGGNASTWPEVGIVAGGGGGGVDRSQSLF